MVYVKHFDILGIDTAQIPCIELNGVPNAATVGAVGLLGMDVTSEGHEIYVCTAVNGAIYTWQSLKDGKDGACVIKSEIINNELILTLSDGKTLNAGVVCGEKGEKGEDGVDGKDGVSVTDAQIDTNGELIITLSNGTSKNAGVVVGDDGISIIKTELNANSELLITLSNDTIINVGCIKGERGEKGDTNTEAIAELTALLGDKQDKIDPSLPRNPSVVGAITDLYDLIYRLPTVTKSDNGKILQVVNGEWAASELPVYDGTVTVV